MEGLLTALLLAIQVVNGSPVNQECCTSKTVGDYSYTRVDTSVGFPETCLARCAYRRDDQPEGSLFCFAVGSLPVKCTEEEGQCYPGPPGPTGCPPDENLRIIGENPDTISSRPSSDDCLQYCKFLHWSITLLHECFAWTYNTNTGMCYTFDSFPICYSTKNESGWISGAPCLNEQTDTFTEADVIPGSITQQPESGPVAGPWGNYSQATPFSDKEKVYGPVDEITIFTGKRTFPTVVVGIIMNYGGTTVSHGSTTGENYTQTVCKRSKSDAQFFGGVNGQAFQTKEQNNLIFLLEFLDTNGKTICTSPATSTGSENLRRGPVPKQGTTLWYISGSTTDDAPTAMGSLKFYFKK